jgi:hypothetical protein
MHSFVAITSIYVKDTGKLSLCNKIITFQMTLEDLSEFKILHHLLTFGDIACESAPWCSSKI